MKLSTGYFLNDLKCLGITDITVVEENIVEDNNIVKEFDCKLKINYNTKFLIEVSIVVTFDEPKSNENIAVFGNHYYSTNYTFIVKDCIKEFVLHDFFYKHNEIHFKEALHSNLNSILIDNVHSIKLKYLYCVFVTIIEDKDGFSSKVENLKRDVIAYTEDENEIMYRIPMEDLIKQAKNKN